MIIIIIIIFRSIKITFNIDRLKPYRPTSQFVFGYRINMYMS